MSLRSPENLQQAAIRFLEGGRNLEPPADQKFYLASFCKTIEPLQVNQTEIQGKVLVLGAKNFPEITLVCTPESGFTVLKPGIDSVFCGQLNLHIDNLLKQAINNKDMWEIDSAEPGKIYRLPRWPFEMTHYGIKEIFDTILLFRVHNIEEQILEDTLLLDISTLLKTGGFFIASGDIGPRSIQKIQEFPSLSLERFERMADDPKGDPSEGWVVDYTGYQFSPLHNGIVLRKTTREVLSKATFSNQPAKIKNSNLII